MKSYSKYETIIIDGMKFHIGYQADKEFSGKIFEVYKNGEWHGALYVACGLGRELGFNSGVYATEEEANTIQKTYKTYFCK